MPIAMPSADRNTRSGRVRSPAPPTRSTSAGRQPGAASGRIARAESRTSRPSRRRRRSAVAHLRPAAAGRPAISRSWVMTTTVVPAACSSRSSVHHPGAGRGVEVAGRLVGQQQRRVADHRAGDRDPLPLAAGQLVRPVVEPVAQADPVQRRLGPPPPLAAAARRRRAGRRRRCPARGTPGGEVELLEHEADPAAPAAPTAAGRTASPRRARRCARCPRTGRSSVPIRCSMVDLPEPDGPTIATSSPCSIARSTRRAAR